MPLFNSILENLNNIIIIVVSVAFSFQLIYTLLFFLPSKKYPKAKTKHKVGIIVPARNEADVIERTISKLLTLNYPKDCYEIIVIADNCTDNTAEIVKSIQSPVKIRVIERHEENKKKHNVGWAMKYAFEQLMPEIDNFEFFVRFDADAIPDKDYLNYMNDAFESGAQAAKGYNHASNFSQNVVSKVSALWYIRDSRFACQARSALHTDVFLVGGGMMFSAQSIKENNGWSCTTSCEDTEFTIWNMDKKKKVEYVPNAIVYEDQPSTIKDLFKRNIRLGHSLHKLFWAKGIGCFFKAIFQFRYCYLDMFLNLLFIPIAVLCCLWFPFFYGYSLIYNAVVGDIAQVQSILTLIAIILVCAFLVPFILQALLVYALDKKKIGIPFKKVIGAIFAFPMFMIVYAISIVIGVLSKQKWSKVKRNSYCDDILALKETSALPYSKKKLRNKVVKLYHKFKLCKNKVFKLSCVKKHYKMEKVA